MGKTHSMQPRIRGKAYQKEDGSWSWEAVVTLGDMDVNDPEAMVLGPKDEMSFISKDVAIQNMKEASVGVSETIAESLGCPKNDVGYVDLTKGYKKKTKKEFLKSKFGKRYF